MGAPQIIHVKVSGLTASGKTAILLRIRKALERDGYCCASPHLDAEARMRSHEDMSKPTKIDRTVIVLSEYNERS